MKFEYLLWMWGERMTKREILPERFFCTHRPSGKYVLFEGRAILAVGAVTELHHCFVTCFAEV